MESLLHYLPNLQELGFAGYWIVFLLSFAESLAFVGLFIPGTVLLVIIGGFAAHGFYSFESLLILAVAGAILGDGLSYEFGRRCKRSIEKRPRLQKYVEKAYPFFRRHGGKSVFLGRFIGHIRPIVPVIAGMIHMPRLRFYIANILSALGWSLFYLSLGYVFGAAWKVALIGFSRLALILLIPLILLFILAFLWRWTLRRGKALLKVTQSILYSIMKALSENEYIGPWIGRHRRFFSFLHDRISIEKFQGLPLTLLLVAILYSFSVFSGIVEDYLTSDPLIALDVRLANLFYVFRYERLLHFFYAVTVLANFFTVLTAALILTLILWWQHRNTYALVLWLTIIGSEGITTLGKLLFHRLRPSGPLPVLSEDSYSFPSGHATSAVVLFGFLAYLIIREHRSWKVKVSTLFGALMAIVAIDLSRLYLGVHYLSDVLAGNTLSLSILFFAISVGEWIRSRQGRSPPPFSWRSLIVLPLLGGLSIVLFMVLAPLSPKPITQNTPKENVPVNTIVNLFRSGLLPRTTETLIGTSQEPVNILLVVPDECLSPSLAKAGWEEADTPSLQTIVHIAKAAILNSTYPTAPMTPSFYNTQPHTVGFEKETETQSVRSRHHARFWATKYTTRSGTLWVGTVSLDTGIKWGITHHIAPDVDTERTTLVSDLTSAHVISSTLMLTLLPPTLGKSFTGDEFFTDGKTALVILKSCKS